MTPRHVSTAEPDIASIAATIGDPSRALMLMALLDGTERPASELALRAGSSPSAATAHLKRLVTAGLIVGRREGRHHLFRLAASEIGRALETLSAIAPARRVSSLQQSKALERMRTARSCYDHLAGRLGVAVTDSLVDCGALCRNDDGFTIGPRTELFDHLGIDVEAASKERRPLVRACLDWTERRHHLAGSIGAALLERFLAARWVARSRADRSLDITSAGEAVLARTLGIR